MLVSSGLVVKIGMRRERMRIIQVFCHNAVLVRDQQNEKAIVVGTGVGFHKSKGDLVLQEDISEIYCLKKEKTGSSSV